MLSRNQAAFAESPSERIHAIQRCALRTEPEHSDAQLVCPSLSLRKHPTWNEDQGLPAIWLSHCSDSLNEREIEIPSAVVNPTQIARAVEVTRSTSLTGSDHSVARTEVDHPSAAQIHGFGIVRTPAHRLGMQHVHVHGSRLHPTAEIAAMSVGTES